MKKVKMVLKLDVELLVDEAKIDYGDSESLKQYLAVDILPESLEFNDEGRWNDEIVDTYYGEARIESNEEEDDSDEKRS